MSPHPHRPRSARRRLTRLATGVVLALGLMAPQGVAQAANPVTPGNFTGYGFDQCVAPSQKSMDAWLNSSPFWAVGIYISGDSRGCRNQPNLTPAWISTQLANGWRLLPITLGPQASCHPSFPRYNDDVTISPRSTKRYRAARRQGRREAVDAVGAAQRLGIRAGSTLWYDLEGYDIGNTACRESALAFTAAWTNKLHALDYVSGVYSSAGSHIKAMDDVRVNRPNAWALPDRIWIARWDGEANTSTSYIREDGWRPGGRVKQYRGDHNETHGGVTINIDSNFLDVGKGTRARREPKRCGGVQLSFPAYSKLQPGATGDQVRAAQCLLRRSGHYDGSMSGELDTATGDAVRGFRRDLGMRGRRVVNPRVWVALHTVGGTRLVKYGASGEVVRRLQRALNAGSDERLQVDGVFAGSTMAAVKRYQAGLDYPRTGVVTPYVWTLLQAGRR